MNPAKQMYFVFLASAFLLSGCVVRTYQTTKDRVDQDLQGNRGYLKGRPVAGEKVDRKTTRSLRVVELELHSPLKFEKGPSQEAGKVSMKGTVAERTEDKGAWGNRGYISSSDVPEIAEPIHAAQPADFEKYTVQKNDTLQKISLKFFGTTKKWQKIFEANKSTLKAPNKIYPGQTLIIPVQGPVAAEDMKKFK